MAENGPSEKSSNTELKLLDIFNKIWEKWEYLEQTDEATNSYKFQSAVTEGIKLSSEAILRINGLRLFSDNETLDEVATNEIRYMLLSALLGYFHVKVTAQDRLQTVIKAEAFYKDYLRLCKNYELRDVDIPHLHEDEEADDDEKGATPVLRPGMPDLSGMNARRQQKIQRFKQQKQFDQEIKEMKSYVDKDHVDDEVKRKYYTTLLKKWVNVSLDELDSIQDEIGILQSMAMRNLGDQKKTQPKPEKKPFRPFILTKSDIQKRVFGAGYPSLPTYTIEEFFDQQMALGNVPQPDSASQAAAAGPDAEAASQEREAEEKEKGIEKDDLEALAKARSWDDWKDDHRIGWGNTHNKG